MRAASAQRVAPVAVGPQLGRELVGLLVLVEQRLDLRSADRRDHVGQIADAVAVDREAEPDLRLDLVAFGDGDVAHVVAEARDPERLGLVPAARRARPGADPLARRPGRCTCPATVLRATRIRVRRCPNSRSPWADWLRFMKSMSISRPRQIAVELRVQVQERLLQRRRARRSTSSPARTCASTRSRRRSGRELLAARIWRRIPSGSISTG